MYLLRGITKKISKFLVKGNQFNIKPLYKIETTLHGGYGWSNSMTMPYYLSCYHTPESKACEMNPNNSKVGSLKSRFGDKLYTSVNTLLFFKVLQAKLNSNEIIKPVLGCATQEHRKGIRVLTITKDSLASRSNLEVGDILTQINGIDHKGVNEFYRILSSNLENSSEVILTVIRDNLIKHIKLVV